MKSGLILGHLKYDTNEGAMLRTAEAFGMTNAFVLGDIPEGWNSAARGSQRHMIFQNFRTVDEIIGHIFMNNYNIVAIENAPDAIDMREVNHYPVNPVFVSGHENHGVPEEFLSSAKMVIKIAQGTGYVRCLNTSVAFGIVAHDFYRKISGGE